MKTLTHVFSQVTSFANLCRAFHAASRGKRDRPEVQRFAYRLEDQLWAIKHELEAEQYVWGRYRPFWIYDPKKRLIKAAPFRDRIVHHALYRVLEPVYEKSYISEQLCLPEGERHPGRGAALWRSSCDGWAAQAMSSRATFGTTLPAWITPS